MEPTGKELAEYSILKSLVFGDAFEVDASDPDGDTNADIKKFFHDAEVKNKTGGGASCIVDLPLPPSDDVDSEENSPFWKAPVIVRFSESTTPTPNGITFTKAPRTLAKKLGIVRTERVTTADGDVWIHAFNSRNELVDARILLSGD